MLTKSLFGRATRHYFDVTGQANRLQYFGFLGYVAGATSGLMVLEQQVQRLQGQQVTLSALFLGLHVIPLVGVFLRRLRDAGQPVQQTSLPIWVALLAAFPVALHFGVGTLYALIALTLGQMLCFDALRQPTEIQQQDEEEEATWTPSVWHQLPPSASRGTSEIYRVRAAA